MVSSAVNSAETRYGCPGSRPTTFGVVEVAMVLATTRVSGLSSGISVIAVSTLSVLAGRYQPCGSLAASTCPVPASAMTNAEACTPGNRGTPGAALTITPRPDSSVPPMACGRLAGAAASSGEAGTGAGPPVGDAGAGVPGGPPARPPDGTPDAAAGAAAGPATAASTSRAPAAASAARRGFLSGISLRAPVLGSRP